MLFGTSIDTDDDYREWADFIALTIDCKRDAFGLCHGENAFLQVGLSFRKRASRHFRLFDCGDMVLFDRMAVKLSQVLASAARDRDLGNSNIRSDFLLAKASFWTCSLINSTTSSGTRARSWNGHSKQSLIDEF